MAKGTAEGRLLSTMQRKSDVKIMDSDGKVYKGFTVWTDKAPYLDEHPEQLYVRCMVMPDSTNSELKLAQIDPKGREDQTFTVKPSETYNTNSELDPMSFGDMGGLTHTNYPCMLDFARQRYMAGQIYTTADPLLIAVNPYENLKNATDQIIQEYRDAQDSRKLAPHVFLTARDAVENLRATSKSQTIVVSGESGSGKTEATKQMMRFLASSKKSSSDSDKRVQNAIMAANPILEAFGNAKTVRNNNSSRFGRFMQLDISKDGGINHGRVIGFLLEKSRVITQDSHERNYHIFYQLLKGASQELKNTLKLLPLTEYNFINPKSLDADGIDDVKAFEESCSCFSIMGFSDHDQSYIWSLIAGILLMGNVKFVKQKLDGMDDAAQLNPSDAKKFKDACKLMFLDSSQLENELTIKKTYAGKQEITSRWKANDAEMLKLSLCKALYEKTFQYIINSLNKVISTDKFDKFIGMLDIFGFELFENNSIEQFFINATNEVLQQNFVNIVFAKETALYKSENINIPDIQYTSNQHIIDATIGKKQSVLTVLEDLCLAPQGDDEKLVGAINSQLKNSSAVTKAKISNNINFTINHTIGPISYNATGFIFKNRDILRPEIMDLINGSSNPLVKKLFLGVTVEKGKIAKGQLIGSQFQKQVFELMNIINDTDSHFIRCVNPNSIKSPKNFDTGKVSVQFLALSIFESVGLSLYGYSYHRKFNEFLDQFRYVHGGLIESLGQSPDSDKLKNACKTLLKSGGIDTSCYQIGETMVFMKQEYVKLLSIIQRDKLAAWVPLVSFIESCIVKKNKIFKISKIAPYLNRIDAHIKRVLKDTKNTSMLLSAKKGILANI